MAVQSPGSYFALLGRLHMLAGTASRPAARSACHAPAAVPVSALAPALAPALTPAEAPRPRRPRRPRPDGATRPRRPVKDQPASGSGPLLRRGYRGKPIKALQARLEALGSDPGPVDGLFGPLTRRAVRRFQRRHALAVDGIVGPETWKALGIHVKGRVRRMAPSGLRIGAAGGMAVVQGKRMTRATAKAFVAMAKAASRAGIALRVNSAYRSDAEQAVLFREAVRKYGSPAAASKWVAPPGQSKHRTGRALDINLGPGVYSWLRAHAGRSGFGQPMSWEPWHWEHRG